MNIPKTSVIVVLFLLLSGFLPNGHGDVRAESDPVLSKGQTLYVPIYSHIYSGNREQPFYLAVTVSIRNIDPVYPIDILLADYNDSGGKLIKQYIEGPLQLNALSTTRFIIKEADKIGGSGANFIIKWSSARMVNPPIIESVMIGTYGQQGISFTSRSKVIKEHTE
ncbi:MAG: DUF3124 domain-containing protein [Desulfobacterales bacterium]|nr:DUF3124 domain-containing protein [Desulfobacterales bacterium]